MAAFSPLFRNSSASRDQAEIPRVATTYPTADPLDDRASDSAPVPTYRLDFSPPTRWQRRGELRAFRELPRLVVASRRLAGLASPQDGTERDGLDGELQSIISDGDPGWPGSADDVDYFDSRCLVRSQDVLVVPGLGTNDVSTLPLRRYLQHLGHRCQGWGFGFNEGQLDQSLADVAQLTIELSDEVGGPITLIGQSLGGVYVREAARNLGERVSQVITLGTPLWGPRFTAAASHFRGQICSIEERITEGNKTPIEVPVTAFYSPRDGVVDWRSCIDTNSPNAENIRVLSTHFGMGLDPDVLTDLATRIG